MKADRSASEKIGFIAQALDPAFYASKTYPISDQSATLQSRAKSYLHSNCAHCHRPGGPSSAAIDLRYQIPFAGGPPNMGLCFELPQYDDMGLTNAYIVTPGNHEQSILSQRMASGNGGLRMPPLGNNIDDIPARSLIDAWINDLAGCI